MRTDPVHTDKLRAEPSSPVRALFISCSTAGGIAPPSLGSGMTASMDERRIAFEGCFNFRDLGGYEAGNGRSITPRRLYRADGPHALTEADAVKMRGLGLVTVIDLRTAQEAQDRGRYVTTLGDVVEHHLPMIDVLPDTDELPEWIDPEVVAGQYRNMLEHGSPAVAAALTILSDPSAYPAMFHCSAGKDRTGILAAFVLGVAGVADDTIVADYALSATAMQQLIAHYQREYPDAHEQLARVAPAMVAAHPEAMAAFVGGIRRDYGSFDGLAAAIGAPDAPARIRAALLS
jgi:protein-tyrosine phosphatase